MQVIEMNLGVFLKILKIIEIIDGLTDEFKKLCWWVRRMCWLGKAPTQ